MTIRWMLTLFTKKYLDLHQICTQFVTTKSMLTLSQVPSSSTPSVQETHIAVCS